ncbi:hypothetical protein PVAND_012258 [Polypedilum vanderplanki]|uniref:Uncharacterized protein n=1 Tax=Polypedilum vanderplanki TaxID=319348 RepID=A0A9J6CLW0_POLVA|nr:hypothetical protein PVAND_012258 [Polypedilum vanderplanki]
MGKKKEVAEEDLLIPPQDSKICGTICVCQMTLVLSCVAIVYLTVAVYVPAQKAFNSGIETDPVMCITTKSALKESCNWTTCGEWCLSKGTGACLQIFVNLRYNGSSIQFQNCTNFVTKKCYGLDTEVAKNFTCIKEECKNLTGIFNCTKGVCHNLTDVFECEFHNLDPVLKCSGRRGKVTCMEINGLYSCNKGGCEKIKAPYNCDRRCRDIPTRNKNVILLSGDNVYLSKCNIAYNSTSKDEVWSDTGDNILMASCYTANYTANSGIIDTTDCVNGSILLNKTILGDTTNFTYLSYLHYAETEYQRQIAPLDADLIISNESRLMINLEGCVNTLRDECKEFFRYYAKDGSDHNARARFPCFYSPNDVSFAVQRFDLTVEYQQFMFAFLLPTILLVVSCFILTVCQKTVVVGDDSKMRFKCLTNEDTGKLKSSTNAQTDAL